MTAIKATGLCKRYGAVTALDGLDLEVDSGQLFALLGINGAGKTTVIRLLTCLAAPTAGEALVGGCSITREPEKVKRMIGVSPQETAVAPNLSVTENLELMGGIYGFSRDKIRQRIKALTGQLGLEPVLERRAGTLSGGWQRRVSIAMALLGEPAILFLDEPTLGLDVLARHDLWKLIRSLKGTVTIILTTHYLEEAEALSDRIGVLKQGRLLAAGTAAQLMQQTGTGNLEDAFVKLVQENAVWG